MANHSSKLQTKDILYQKARSLFFQKGFVKTTLSEISKETTINSAMVSYYFKNKLNLALLVNNDYLLQTKKLTLNFLKQLNTDADLMLLTAVEYYVLSKNMQHSSEFRRFYQELNNTNFYLNKDTISIDFFENLNKTYHLGFDKNIIRAVTVTNYAVVASLFSAKQNGFLDCSYDYITETAYSQFAIALGFSQSYVDGILASGRELVKNLDYVISDGFEVFYAASTISFLESRGESHA